MLLEYKIVPHGNHATFNALLTGNVFYERLSGVILIIVIASVFSCN